MSQSISEPLVLLRDVVRTFETPAEVIWAVKDVNLEAHGGEFVCIYGASGSGKSSLLSLIAGLDLPQQGEIHVDGTRVDTLEEAARAEVRRLKVGIVFQDDGLIDEFTAAENAALPLEAQGVGTTEALAQASQLLDQVGLSGLEDRFPRQLSGGQRQRVGVARALSGGRKVLLADEPTGALDSKNSRELISLLKSLAEQGACVIVCSHDESTRLVADSVYEMTDGTLERVHVAVR